MCVATSHDPDNVNRGSEGGIREFDRKTLLDPLEFSHKHTDGAMSRQGHFLRALQL